MPTYLHLANGIKSYAQLASYRVTESNSIIKLASFLARSQCQLPLKVTNSVAIKTILSPASCGSVFMCQARCRNQLIETPTEE